MSTFNGWTIVPLPASPSSPKSIEWALADTVGASRNPFSVGQQQTYNWASSAIRASVSYPPMPNAQALPWIVFLMSLQGIANVFSIGDPLNVGPQNLSASGGTVTGSGQTGYTLITTSSGLTPGDWFSLGLRLYRVMSVSGGILTIWPNIRESPADGTDLVIVNCTGLFRLTKNVRQYTVDENRMYQFTFEIEEAL